MSEFVDDAGALSEAGPGAAGSSWARTRHSFSCTDQVWGDAKAAWSSVRREYLAWTQWLEAALTLKAAAVRAELGRSVLDPAPERLPTGRRVAADAPTGRSRRAFTCSPEVWAQARAAWWTQEESYPAWSDWVEEAIVEMTARTTDR
ncbi:hypothetical protein HQ346_24805 [Rhodococcus sp. BP-252]|uniref:hypothetical protein n=1 Tax=unclassified Rhodococcus (in: high G+C Gram-positive bacteria) TaxID=192944 RepID=UPI001C9AA098|nr:MULTISPECIES: hypothetical protein [unclassified Rhodococcus (in: high G+C Gram-positive bacteria)]MBY6414824.1 hypothetical protein [Rhodococcus sp. BP-320]MBY6419727.1 hypothetical protein [Rhodococcus sp. BP-321]MBY6424704.1 hypothetical protein [Rhodococcus sp. BP-324]MBY6429702.1 hypothetical protein [Rhodococcus sp. BP-323]MBY6434674.1 hypothetical protein [Rhodococcus sp. BP-322]